MNCDLLDYINEEAKQAMVWLGRRLCKSRVSQK